MPEQVVVQSSKVRILPKGQQVWVLKCGEVPDRDAAEQLSGYKIVIPITQREQLKVRGSSTLAHVSLCSLDLRGPASGCECACPFGVPQGLCACAQRA